MIRAVLFDLDGTLVDSAPAILGTFRQVFASHGISLSRELDESVVGPTLRETITGLTGITDPNHVDKIAASFREHYDTWAVNNTPAFPGYHETLDAVRGLGYEVLVVTNKRIEAARAIVQRLGGAHRYVGILSPDVCQPPLLSKTAVVKTAVQRHHIDVTRSVVVGDSADDARAALANGMQFIAALYGYGGPDLASDTRVGGIASLTDLPAQLARVITGPVTAG